MDVLGLRQVHPKPCQILAVKNAELPSSDPLYGTYVYVYVSTFFYFLMKGEQRCCRVFLKLSSDKSCSTVPWQSVLTNTLTSSNPRCIELRAIPFPLATSACGTQMSSGCLFLVPNVLLHFCVHQMQSKGLIPDFEIMKRQEAQRMTRETTARRNDLVCAAGS